MAAVLQNWIKDNVNPNRIHLIGFSLGAHVCGLIGRTLRGVRHTIGRLTALDPAGPLYCTGHTPSQNALKRNDARFVDVIHTDDGIFGCGLTLGRADFFLNGGKRPQPMCGNSFLQLLAMFLGKMSLH